MEKSISHSIRLCFQVFTPPFHCSAACRKETRFPKWKTERGKEGEGLKTLTPLTQFHSTVCVSNCTSGKFSSHLWDFYDNFFLFFPLNARASTSTMLQEFQLQKKSIFIPEASVECYQEVGRLREEKRKGKHECKKKFFIKLLSESVWRWRRRGRDARVDFLRNWFPCRW